MHDDRFADLLEGLTSGRVVPYLGPGVLADVQEVVSGRPMPLEGDALILALNGGKPLGARLTYEFSRAAMHVELKKGRKALTAFLTQLYGTTAWTRAAIHEWLGSLPLPYVIDTNRDLGLQELWAGRPHTLVVGVARVAADPARYRLWESDGTAYREVRLEAVDPDLPVLFKPLGTARPEPTFVASDADYVDYITELMGGFAVPGFLKKYRRDKQYLLLGLRLTRDTQRMILSDLIADAGSPAGRALLGEPTDKERRYCASKGIEIVEGELEDLLAAACCSA